MNKYFFAWLLLVCVPASLVLARQGDDECGIASIESLDYYNFGCSVASYICTCSTLVGISSIALWVSNCENPQQAWDSVMSVYCVIVPGALYLDGYTYEEVYQNATQYAVSPSEVFNYSSPVYPVSVDEETQAAFFKALTRFDMADQASWNYTWATLGYWAGVFVIAAVINFSTEYLPHKWLKSMYDGPTGSTVNWFRRYISIPATAGAKHCVPVYILGYKTCSPTRIQSIIIWGFTILTFVLHFPEYYAYEDNILYPGTSLQLGMLVGIRSGRFATLQLPLLFLFAFRNNFFQFITGWSYSTFSIYHRAIAWIIYIELAVHCVAYTAMDVHLETLSELYSYGFMKWGAVAMAAGAIVLCTAVKWLRDRNYEVFLVFHIIFVIFFTIGTWYHVAPLGYKECMYSVFAIWAFERVARLVRVAYFGIRSTCQATLFEDGTMKFAISPSRKFGMMPGQYIFMHILRFNAWESHPFSIVECDRDSGQIVLLAKAHDGMTRKTARFLNKCKSQKIMKVWLDGPYGKSVPVEHYENALMIAGGIGFTAIVPYALKALEKGYKTHIKVIWITPSQSSLEWAHEYLDRLAAAGIQVTVYCTDDPDQYSHNQKQDELKITSAVDSIKSGTSTPSKETKTEPATAEITCLPHDHNNFQVMTSTRPSVEPIISETVNEWSTPNGYVDMAVVVCGPDSMNDDSRAAVVNVLGEHRRSRIDYYEEAFNW